MTTKITSKLTKIDNIEEDLDDKGRNIAIEFAKFLNREGWREYLDEDRWIQPTNNYNVYSTAQVYDKFFKPTL